MKLGVSSFAFGWAIGVPGHPPSGPFDEINLLTFARDQDLSLVQIGDHLPLHTYDAQRIAALKAAAGKGSYGIELEIGARGLTEAHLAAYIALARTLDSPLLRFVIDHHGYEPDAATVVAIVRAARPLLDEAQLTLGIENHDRFPVKVLRRMIEEIGSDRVGICLDTVNSISAGEGLAQVLDQLGPLTVNLHVKDFMISRISSAMGYQAYRAPH